jgi:hypothetical protein
MGIIHSNQINDCPVVTVQDVDVAHKSGVRKEHRGIKRQDHMKEDNSCGKGLCEDPKGAPEAPQGGIFEGIRFHSFSHSSAARYVPLW